MAQVITFERYQPVARFDGNPWTDARVEESTLEAGPWTAIETIALSPVDADPTDPATRNLTTELASDTVGLWYRIIFEDASGDESLPTAPVQNTATASSYGTTDELFRRLKVRTPSDDQESQGYLVLLMATEEINSEINLSATAELSAGQTAIATEVCYKRAVELWAESPFGLIGLENAEFTTHTARNTWERYALMLAPLKNQWGLS